MTNIIDGSPATNINAKFQDTTDPSFYEADNEGQQLYLESVVPHAFDPTLEAFNTRALNPKKYIEQNKYGFHDLTNNKFQYTYDNTDPYFNPQFAELIHFDP